MRRLRTLALMLFWQSWIFFSGGLREGPLEKIWHEAFILMRRVRTLELVLFQAGSGRGLMGKFQTRVSTFMRRLRTFEGSELELFEKGALA